MTLTASDLAGQLGLAANDPRASRAATAAYAWACDVYRVDDVDDLELNAAQLEAVAGYARDLIKLPGTTFGYFAAGDNDPELAAAVGSLDRRWRPMLIGSRQVGFV